MCSVQLSLFTLSLLFVGLEFQTIPDFRYNSARIDAITKLPNGTMMLVSNGYYWMLSNKEYPRKYNVRGRVTELYPKFKKVNAIFTDPYNEMYPKIYMISNSRSKGLMVACQEDSGNFESDNSFCHLPVDKNWNLALKDLNLKAAIDGATWRNRSRDKDGGFWVFFQGKKLTVIDPYKMELRFTYDIQQWMLINETITATYYDYKQHCYHIFFDHNKYHIWKVNVTLMNRLPMGWDRAFLHGSLSRELKINRDFFKIPSRELLNYNQPYFVPEFIPEEEVEEVTEKAVVDEEEQERREENENNIAVIEKKKKDETERVYEISNEIESKQTNQLGLTKKHYIPLSDQEIVPKVISNACNIMNNGHHYHHYLLFFTLLFYRCLESLEIF